MKKIQLVTALVASVGAFSFANAEDYTIDQAHTTIEFKASHLGFSYVVGRFDDFEGTFYYDSANPKASKVSATIDTASINSNHTARDKHLKSDDFLNAAKFPEAKFESTSFKVTDKENAVMIGDFTLNGVTKAVSIDVTKIGEGKDPWGGYRAGFEGSFDFGMDDFDFKSNYGKVMVDITIEGIKK